MEPEVIVNLWLFLDKGSRLIYGLAVRPYMVSGTDEAKLQLLNALASSDFHFARRFNLPDRYSVEFGGKKRRGVTFAGGVGPVYEGVDPFQEAFDLIARDMPARPVGIDGKQTSKAPLSPNNLLHVRTFVQVDENGNQVAQITNRAPSPHPQVAVANLWTFLDERVKAIYALAGRAYMVQGTDAEKQQILQTLASSDFAMVNPVPVPDGYSMNIAGAVRKGVIDDSSAANEGKKLFQDVFQAIQRDIPTVSLGLDGRTKTRAAFLGETSMSLITRVTEGTRGTASTTMQQAMQPKDKPWWKFW